MTAKATESFEISTPNPNFKGERAGLKFTGGKASTNDPEKAQACRELGYKVKELTAAK